MKRALIVLCIVLMAAAPPQRGTIVITPHPVKHIATLLFHQISTNPIMSAHGADHVQEPWTTPAAFDELLSNLEHDGYTVVSMRSALDYLEGKTSGESLPAKPLLLTFDDGYLSALTEGTPILRKHHATATMFFEGHATGNPAIPGRLNENDLRTMAQSGIWTLESHGWAGHSNIQVDADGHLSPYWYANLAWLPAAHRLETPAEFQERVFADVSRMRTAFQAAAGHALTIFAYPSGEFGQNGALLPNQDPRTLIEAGHSNARDLEPLLVSALKKAGYEAAFAVSLPDTAHFANSGDNLFALPRVGVGAKLQYTFLRTIEAQQGIEFPEVADGQFADVGPICASKNFFFAAATNRPVIFALDRSGRVVTATDVPALTDGRPSLNAKIGGLACDGDTVYAVQQAGFDPHPQPWLDRFTITTESGELKLENRTALGAPMNWLVGIGILNGHVMGVSDSGAILDATTGRQTGSLPLDGGSSNTRFAGLSSNGDLLYSIDRAEKQLVAFTVDGTVVARTSLDAGMHDLAFDGNRLLLSFWTDNEHSLRFFDVAELPH